MKNYSVHAYGPARSLRLLKYARSDGSEQLRECLGVPRSGLSASAHSARCSMPSSEGQGVYVACSTFRLAATADLTIPKKCNASSPACWRRSPTIDPYQPTRACAT